MVTGGCLPERRHGTLPPVGWGWGASKGAGSVKSLGLTESRDNRFSVLAIPDGAGHLGRAENKVGAPWAVQPVSWPREGERERAGTE